MQRAAQQVVAEVPSGSASNVYHLRPGVQTLTAKGRDPFFWRFWNPDKQTLSSATGGPGGCNNGGTYVVPLLTPLPAATR